MQISILKIRLANRESQFALTVGVIACSVIKWLHVLTVGEMNVEKTIVAGRGEEADVTSLTVTPLRMRVQSATPCENNGLPFPLSQGAS